MDLPPERNPIRSKPMTLVYIIGSSLETSAVVAVSGSVFYFFKGALRHSSDPERRDDFAAGAEEFFANEPCIRRCAAWSGVMSGIDLALQHARRVDDPLNMMVAWGAANVLFSVHRGPRAAVREGLKGAAVGGAVSITLFALLHFVCSKKGGSC